MAARPGILWFTEPDIELYVGLSWTMERTRSYDPQIDGSSGNPCHHMQKIFGSHVPKNLLFLKHSEKLFFFSCFHLWWTFFNIWENCRNSHFLIYWYFFEVRSLAIGDFRQYSREPYGSPSVDLSIHRALGDGEPELLPGLHVYCVCIGHTTFWPYTRHICV